MTTPASLYKNIRALVYQQTHPLCLLVDQMRRVQICIGDLAFYGYKQFSDNEDCTEQLTFLVGLDFTESIELMFVGTPNAKAAHVYIMPQGGSTQIILLDASEQKIAQVNMQQKANELYLLHEEQTKILQGMRVLEAELERKKVEAEKANQLKSHFIANMSHEFRTPLNTIIGFTDLMQQETNNDSVHSDYLTAVDQGAKHLLNLVENLLDQAQIETSSVEIYATETDLNEVFTEIETAFASLAKQKSIEFEVVSSSLPNLVSVDELRLRQIVVNLVGNAIKFTDNGSVQLSIFWSCGDLSIEVTDSGCGISEASKEQIFKPFEQLQNRPGSGLGLSIVKYLVEKMVGCITLESTPGVGSCFKVVLPAELIRTSQSVRPLQKLNISDLSIPAKLLVVEDNPDILQLLRIVLENVDCTVLVSADGIDGVEKCLAEQPDLVLMDLNLPEMSGYEATRKLRAAGFTKPIFALSASTSADHKQRALDAGCDDYVIKPFDIPHLLILIQQVINQSKSQGMPKRRRKELNARFEASLDDKLTLLDQTLIALRSEQYSHGRMLKLRRFIHNLAGSAGLYGYNNISDIAKQIDDLLYDNLHSDSVVDSGFMEVLDSKIGDLRALLMTEPPIVDHQ